MLHSHTEEVKGNFRWSVFQHMPNFYLENPIIGKANQVFWPFLWPSVCTNVIFYLQGPFAMCWQEKWSKIHGPIWLRSIDGLKCGTQVLKVVKINHLCVSHLWPVKQARHVTFHMLQGLFAWDTDNLIMHTGQMGSHTSKMDLQMSQNIFFLMLKEFSNRKKTAHTECIWLNIQQLLIYMQKLSLEIFVVFSIIYEYGKHFVCVKIYLDQKSEFHRLSAHFASFN